MAVGGEVGAVPARRKKSHLVLNCTARDTFVHAIFYTSFSYMV